MNSRLASASLLLLLACAGIERLPAPEAGSTVVDAERAVAFQQRASIFYRQLAQRRFNALETFNDPVLRAHFLSEDLFFDYYADLAQSLSAAHFEKSRPSAIEVQEFLFESDQRVLVQIRFIGDDRRPLRPDSTMLVRRDRWQWSGGTWWMTPGKL